MRSCSMLGAHVISNLTSSEMLPNSYSMHARLPKSEIVQRFVVLIALRDGFLLDAAIPAFQF